jgi:hypothetical protein
MTKLVYHVPPEGENEIVSDTDYVSSDTRRQALSILAGLGRAGGAA